MRIKGISRRARLALAFVLALQLCLSGFSGTAYASDSTAQKSAVEESGSAGDTSQEKAAEESGPAGDTSQEKAAEESGPAGDTSQEKAAEESGSAGDTSQEKAAEESGSAGGTSQQNPAEESASEGDSLTVSDSGEEEAFFGADEDEWAGGTDSLQDLGIKNAERRVDDLFSKMTLREKVGQMVMVSFRGWPENPDDFPSAFNRMSDKVAECIAENRFGGILLYGENCRENEETIRLINDMQAANLRTESEVVIPMLIATDQEGGIVTRLRQGTKWPGNMALAATGDKKNARTVGREIGKELSHLSINMDFSPVVDINDNPQNPAIGVRSFSDDAATVSEYSREYFEGMVESGTIPVIKHFPGHGNTDTDSHSGLPSVNRTLEELNEKELIPFRVCIDAGAEAIMTAHTVFPAIEKEEYTSKATGEKVTLPATLSKTILTDILRQKMGFEGVIVTDALEMNALTEHFEEKDVYRLAVNAGADILTVPLTVINNDTMEKLEEAVDSIVEMAEKGEISQDRIDESVYRILQLKARHGLLEPSGIEMTQEQIREEASKVGSEETRDKEWEITSQSLTLLKNDKGVFPYKAEDQEKVLVLFPGQSRLNTAAYAERRLKEEKLIPENTVWTSLVYTPDNIQECIDAAQNADHVIAVTTLFEAGELDPETEIGESGRVLDRIIEAVHEMNKPIALICAQLPYDAARYQSADVIMTTYGSAPMPEMPEDGALFSPNLPAAICAVFGEFKPGGTLPVDIPELDKQYGFSDRILYPKGFSEAGTLE